MTATAFGLVIGAAVLHAAWNMVVKASPDRLVAAWCVVVGAAVLNIPVLVIAGLPDPSVRTVIVISAAVHLVYNLTLVAAYERADLAVVYPIARGTAPLLVTILGVALLNDDVGITAGVGVCLVTAGLAVIALGGGQGRGVGWALATGVAIATYTVLDGAGVRAGGEAMRLLASVFVLHAVALTVVVALRRGLVPALGSAAADLRPVIVGGAGSAGAYLLVLMAARDAPVGLVAGLRETSVLIGIAAGRVILGEQVTARHLLAGTASVIGAVAIVMG